MFRTMSRVAVVAIVLVALTCASIPAYAAPHGGSKATAKAEAGWIQAVITWVSQALFGTQPPMSFMSSPSSTRVYTPLNGSCIDPLGGCGIGGGGGGV